MYLGGVNTGGLAAYWKNSQETDITALHPNDYFTGIHSIFVLDGDIYLTGYLVVPANGGTNAPAYWKNGVEYDLPLNGATYGSATSIFVSGTDVYLTGETSDGAVYWKNGVETILSSTGSAIGIYVQ